MNLLNVCEWCELLGGVFLMVFALRNLIFILAASV